MSDICVGDYRPSRGYLKYRGFTILINSFNKYVVFFRVPRFTFSSIFYTLEDARNEIDVELEYVNG